MGRKKIVIKPITDERNKQVTLNKRKLGLMKKAYELSVLCGCEIALIIFDSHDRNYIYGSHGTGDTLQRYMKAGEPIESHTNATISRLLNEKGKKGGSGSAPITLPPIKPVPEVLPKMPSFTPGTEARFRDIENKYVQMLSKTGALAAQSSSSSDSLLPATKSKDLGLRVHIPGSSKAFPPGTAPRTAPRIGGAAAAAPGVGTATPLFLSSIPTPSALLPNTSGAGGFMTPSLGGLGGLSPSIFTLPTLPTPSILNMTAQSPGVIVLSGGAGDLHVSNTAMQAHQAQAAVLSDLFEQRVAAMGDAAGASGGNTSDSDEEEEEEDEEGEDGEGDDGEEAAAAALHGMQSQHAAHKRSADALEPDVVSKRSAKEDGMDEDL